MIRKLEGIRQDLTPLAEEGKVNGFLNNVRNTDKLGGLLEDIRDTVMEYQVRASSGYSLVQYLMHVRARLRCNKISTIRVVDSS